jgi:peptide chain release factor 3
VPILAAVGELQFEVAMHRLKTEFNAEPLFDRAPYTLARRTDEAGRARLVGRRGVEIATRADGTILALFTNQAWLDGTLRDNPGILLDTLVGL